MFCTSCGHQLGIGRYCTNCGARVAEATPPEEPGPSAARYPLYADTVQAPPAEPAPTQAPAASYDDITPTTPKPPRRRRSPMPLLIALLLVATVAAIGGALVLLSPSGDEHAVDDRPEPRRDSAQPVKNDDEPDPDPGSGSLLAPADVEVPDTAPPSVDGAGKPVTFTATNMLDDDPTTSWRMAGDGTGAVVTFAFDEAVTVTEVGLVNGYAKIDPPHDWYAGNRRITEVIWVFDDGTEVAQEFDEDRALQTTPVDAVETTTIELRLVQVTDPGTGPDARDYTAISDIAISGTG